MTKLSPSDFAQAQGEKKRGGSAWEAVIETRHVVYRLAKRAYIIHTHPKMVMRGKFHIPAEAAGPDYLVVAQGRTFLVEAKQTTQTRWNLSLLTDTQANHLDAAESHGATGAVLLRFLTAGRTVLLLWSTLGPMWWAWKTRQSKVASLTLEAAEGIAVWSGLGADYLDALLEPFPRPDSTSSTVPGRALEKTPGAGFIPRKVAQ